MKYYLNLLHKKGGKTCYNVKLGFFVKKALKNRATKRMIKHKSSFGFNEIITLHRHTSTFTKRGVSQ